MIRRIKKGNWDRCNARNCGDGHCLHEYIPYACPSCGTQLIQVKTSGFIFCPDVYLGEECFEAASLEAAKERKIIPMVDGEFIPDPPTDLPRMMHSVKKQMPEKQDKRRVLAYTPTDDIVIEWRVIAAELFARVCTDATHWMYLDAPK